MIIRVRNILAVELYVQRSGGMTFVPTSAEGEIFEMIPEKVSRKSYFTP